MARTFALELFDVGWSHETDAMNPSREHIGARRKSGFRRSRVRLQANWNARAGSEWPDPYDFRLEMKVHAGICSLCKQGDTYGSQCGIDSIS